MKKRIACLLLLAMLAPGHAACAKPGWMYRWDSVIAFDCVPARYLGGRSEDYSLLDENGNILKDCWLTYVDAFQENGLARMRMESANRWGLIDRSGRVVVEPVYDYINAFSDGMCEVELDDLSGYIDETGALVIGLQYHYAGGFVDGYAPVGKEDPLAEGGSSADDGVLWGLIDRTGKCVVEMQYTYLQLVEGAGTMIVEQDGAWGLVDIAGKVLIPLEYERVHDTFLSMGVYLCEREGRSDYFCIKDGAAVEIPYPEAAKEVLG